MVMPRPWRRWLAALALSVLLALGGCGSIRYTMLIDPVLPPGSPARVFPSPPDPPRYRYVGQLLGEENFVSDAASARDTGMKLLQWLAGFVGQSEEKMTLKRPQSGMTGSDGRIYVTDVAAHAVIVFDEAAGRMDAWEMADARRRFVTPIGIAEGPHGKVLVADAELGRVFVLDREGKPQGSFGEGALVRPTGLARDASRGRIYVSDTHAHDVKVFDDGGRLVATIGQRGEEEGELNFPTHLAFAGDRLYITDGMNARVQVYGPDGQFVKGFGQRGQYVGNLNRPKGVAVDRGGRIYVVEGYYDNLLVFDGDGRFLMPIGGTGKEIGQFYLPAGVWTDARNRVYVADMFNGRIVIFQYLGDA